MVYEMEKVMQIADAMRETMVIYAVDKNMKIEACSPKLAEILGYDEKELDKIKENGLVGYILSSDRAYYKTKMEIAVRDTDYSEFMIRMRRHNQTFLWVRIKTYLMKDENGKRFLIARYIDTSKYTRVYDVLVNTSDQMMILFDINTYETMYCNSSFCEWAHIEESDFLEKKCYELIFSEDVIKGEFNPFIKNSEFLFKPQFFDERTGKYLSIVGKPVRWNHRDSFILYFSDVTAQKKKDDELYSKYQKHLEDAFAGGSDVLGVFGVNCRTNSFEIHEVVPEAETKISTISQATEFYSKMSEYFDYEEDKLRVAQMFNSEYFVRQYEEEKYRLTFEGTVHLKKLWNVKYVKVIVDLFKNPQSGHIEAIISIRDATPNYILDLLRHKFINDSHDGIVLMDIQHNYLSIYMSKILNVEEYNQKERMLQNTIDESVIRMADKFIVEEDRERFIKYHSLDFIKSKLENNDEYFFTCAGYDQHGRVRYYKSTFFYLDREKSLVAITTDDVQKVLDSDSLTGGLNRQGFLRKAEEIIEKGKDRYSIVFYDIKGFKAINDLFTVNAGNKILRRCYEMLYASPLNPELVGRFESDHFACLVKKNNISHESLMEVCKKKMVINSKEVTIQGICGICSVDLNVTGISGICDRAMIAKNYIEDWNVQPYAIFDDSMRKKYVEEKALHNEIENALKNNEFAVFYQPIMDAVTGKISSAEALVRWIHPERGIISPGLFIPALEESGKISELDLFVEKFTKDFLENRHAQGKKIVPVDINLSWMDFYDNKMIDVILEDIKCAKLPPDTMRVEVTETAYSSIEENNKNVLSTIKNMGTKILVDDFGSGYSSFSTIQNFDFNIIKIDMGFVNQIGKNSKSEKVINSIISMAHNIDAKVIAEGAETQEHIEFLQKNKCDFIQGYFYSKPISADEFAKMLDEE